MDEIENTPSLMNKKADELTVADNFKIMAVVTVAIVAVPALVAGGAAAVQSFADWRRRRKEASETETVEETPVEETTEV